MEEEAQWAKNKKSAIFEKEIRKEMILVFEVIFQSVKLTIKLKLMLKS